MKKIRISAAILALIMIAPVFKSCGSKTKKAAMTINN